MNGKAFMDATCKGCGARIGWFGRVVDRPACHHCGRKPDLTALQADQAEIDKFRELLAELRKADPDWGSWQNARVAAGLTLRQAAKLLETTPFALSAIEQGRRKPLPEFAEAMSKCYGG